VGEKKGFRVPQEKDDALRTLSVKGWRKPQPTIETCFSKSAQAVFNTALDVYLKSPIRGTA